MMVITVQQGEYTGCESWTIKKAECWRIDAFELWCWRRLLRVPWTTRRSNQSILKKINPEYSLERLLQKLKFQYFCHLIQRADTLEKTLILGKTEGKMRRGWQRMRSLYSSTNSMDMNQQPPGDSNSKGQLGALHSMGSQTVRQKLATEQQLNCINRNVKMVNFAMYNNFNIGTPKITKKRHWLLKIRELIIGPPENQGILI